MSTGQNVIQLEHDPALMAEVKALRKELADIKRLLIPAEEYLDAAQVGELLGYAERTVVDKLSKRPGFPHRYGRRWKKSEVLKWAEKLG